MKLENITIGQYLASEDTEEYDFALKYADQAQARDVFGYGDMTKKKFGDVKDDQYLFAKPDALPKFVNKYGADKLQGLNVFDFFAFYRYIGSQVERINNIENALLSHSATEDEQAAGLERFGKYSPVLQIDSLAGGDILKYQAVRELVYEDCLTKLALDKDRNDYQKDYQHIIARKTKHHG